MSAVVSVVIPTYNRAADLCRALASLQRQTETRWEAIVVDNHSSDGTAEAVAALRDTRIRMIPIHNDGVVARSRNLGIGAAAGEYVAFLDSDDWWAPRKLEVSLHALAAGADVVYHDLHWARSGWRSWLPRRARTRALTTPVFRDLLERGNALATSSVVARRALLLESGGFTEEREWIGAEDYDAWLRIARLTDRFERLARPLGYYWVGGGNLTAPWRLIMNLAAFRARYGEGEKAPLERLPAWYHYLLGRGSYSSGEFGVVAEHMRRARAAGLPASLRVRALYLSCAARLRRSPVKGG